MANVVRANREFDQVANFGLGEENQAEDLLNLDGEAGAIFGNGPVDYVDSYPYNEDDPETFGGNSEAAVFARRDSSAESQYTQGADGSEDYWAAVMGQARWERTEAFSGAGFAPELAGVWGESIDFSDTDAGAVVYGGHFMGDSLGGSPGGSIYGVRAVGFAHGNVGDENQNALTGGFFGVSTNTNYTGTISQVEGLRALVSAGNGTWTMTNVRGLYVDYNLGTGTITNLYGVFIEDFTRAGTTLNANLISKGATSNNIFEGHVEIDGNLNHDGAGVGFYGTAPVAKQTGVAVDAAAIHAALVALGLIGA